MGTKELLLVILVTILVAISIAVAVQTINSGEVSPNKSAILQGLNEAIGRSRAYYERPQVYGGGANSFRNLSFDDLLMDSVTAHGTFSITERSHTSVKIEGRPANTNEILTVVIYRDSVVWIEQEQ